MTKIYMIAAVDEDYAIGYENHLLFHLKDDMKQFREKTSFKCIIMGRKTFESLPGSKPLPKRRNIVLSKTLQSYEGVEVYACLDDVMQAIDGEEEVWVIGGDSIYRLFLPYADEIYLTHIHQKAMHADAFFPRLDDSWHCLRRLEDRKEDGIVFHYAQYEKGTH